MITTLASLAQGAAALAALALALRRAEHWPFAASMLAWVISDLARAWLGAEHGLIRPAGGEPFTGAALAAFHADQAIELGAHALIAALAIWYFGPRRWPLAVVGLAWVVTLAYLVTHYPSVRGDALRRVYLGAELAALFVAAVSLLSLWTRRGAMSPSRVCCLLMFFGIGGTFIAGAWPYGLFERYELTAASLLVVYSVLTLYQGALCWNLKRLQ